MKIRNGKKMYVLRYRLGHEYVKLVRYKDSRDWYIDGLTSVAEAATLFRTGADAVYALKRLLHNEDKYITPEPFRPSSQIPTRYTKNDLRPVIYERGDDN